MMSTILPDCMMPDGAEPCKGYQQLNAEVERLRAPHSKDCAFLLNGNKPGRWDCDCDASDLERERAANAKLREALEIISKMSDGRKNGPWTIAKQALLAAKQDEGNGS